MRSVSGAPSLRPSLGPGPALWAVLATLGAGAGGLVWTLPTRSPAQEGVAPGLRREGGRPPRIHLIATGGTIASRAPRPRQLLEYRVALSGAELVAAVPAVAEIAEVSVEQFSNVGSTALTPADWLRLAQRINAVLGEEATPEEGPVDGVVVTHGTDALEETAYFLNLTVRSPKPVVVVGAMRPASALSADGPVNLLDAVRVAADPGARGRGVLVVLNQEINAARDVTKTHTLRLQTFASRGLGILGTVDPDGVVFYRSTERRHTVESEFDVAGLEPEDLPRVDIVYTYGGADGAAIDAFVAAGARGLVLAGAGAGALTPAQRRAAERALAQGVVVVRSSRTGSGRVPGRGGGMVAADDLTPQKARILLMLALTRTSDPERIQRCFDTY